ncbi:helix-turn-helix domain-containing protein [Kitasatospora sp. NPDC050543]|uniref:PucR family transcriptional regulator n=1 Tax=Kitasatospora sp. NPDC050543 TaxID=3364054 RepID=UPI003795486F
MKEPALRGAIGRHELTQRRLNDHGGDGDLSATALGPRNGGAQWNSSGTIQAVALSSAPGDPPTGLSLAEVVADTEGLLPYLLIPDPVPGMHRTLAHWLNGRTAAVGPVVPFEDAGVSLGWARKLLTMAPHWPGVPGELLFVEDHLVKLMLFQDPLLASHLSAKWLGRLRDMTPRQRAWTEETLLAWLEGGGATKAARLLRVHPQTVRYRLRNLERIFGSSLRDSQSRFEILLALKIQNMASESARLRHRAGQLPSGRPHGT